MTIDLPLIDHVSKIVDRLATLSPSCFLSLALSLFLSLSHIHTFSLSLSLPINQIYTRRNAGTRSNGNRAEDVVGRGTTRQDRYNQYERLFLFLATTALTIPSLSYSLSLA